MSEREKILAAAKSAVCGDRDRQYGKPEENFNIIASYWTEYLHSSISPEDVAIMMILFKIARLSGSECQSRDSWVDIAGYAACGAEIALGEGEAT